MSEELKPCPFCGKSPRVTELEFVCCGDDECPGSDVIADADCWNTRAELDDLKAGQGEAVAWRWAWKECREDDGWTYRESPPPRPENKIVQALYASAPPATGVIIDPKLLERSVKHLNNWLSHDLCECEGGHTCGRTEVERDLVELRALLAQVKP